MPQRLHYITIRGTKDGLVFILDDTCSFDDLITELKEKLSSEPSNFAGEPLTAVKLKTGNRYLTEEQKKQVRELILKKKNLIVEDIESDVITKAEAEEIAKQKRITSITQMVRSGQVLEVTGDLLLVGDVNSGASIEATGNIYVMGALKGSAHAGCEGNRKAVIAASVMKPTQVRISDVVSMGADLLHMETEDAKCAIIDEGTGEITVNRVQSLYQRKASSLTTG
ncbi:MAG TPA: septum site-determining protein MinC [Bacillales bacterium]|nr:septum site-determining protein MinC [Bacillales bacterium]